jgi:hypothetical protein
MQVFGEKNGSNASFWGSNASFWGSNASFWGVSKGSY